MKISFKDGSEKDFANLRNANLRNADLRNADLRNADLRYANLSAADLSYADLRYANLRNADLRYANLRNADLRYADLSYADLRNADLRNADLSYANLSAANLSATLGILNPLDFLKENFVQTDKGFIVYKSFNNQYAPPSSWIIKEGSFITEVVNYDPCSECACGINFATKKWIQANVDNKECVIWKCLLSWEGLATLCVPYNTDSKARCGQLLLVEIEK